MFIQTEATPNPATLKFLPGRPVLEHGTLDMRDRAEAANSPLAGRLFDVSGVGGVFLGSDFIAVTKTDGDRDTVDVGKLQARRVHHPRDHRHERFRVAAAHRLRFARQQIAPLGVEHGRRAGIERGIKGEDTHAGLNYAGRTSVTSGTKWRSRFSMPCRKVAVEEGQPEHAPCMDR